MLKDGRFTNFPPLRVTADLDIAANIVTPLLTYGVTRDLRRELRRFDDPHMSRHHDRLGRRRTFQLGGREGQRMVLERLVHRELVAEMRRLRHECRRDERRVSGWH